MFFYGVLHWFKSGILKAKYDIDSLIINKSQWGHLGEHLIQGGELCWADVKYFLLDEYPRQFC